MGEVDPITHMVDVVWEDSIYCVESSILLIVLSKIYLFESIQYPFQRKRIGMYFSSLMAFYVMFSSICGGSL